MIILYHGSNTEVQEPQLLKKQRDLDFGKGFYTTSDFDQAASWARRTARIRGTGVPSVTVYELADEHLRELAILRFPEANRAWLEYITANRRGIVPNDGYDIVMGPVANDQTFPTLLLYLDGFLEADAAIKRLLPQKLRDQIVLKTEKAIALLSCKEVRLV